MKQKKYLWTLYLIMTTIIISIATQIYFNYKNYQKNKQQFINEVQISLDNTVDNYFAELAKKKFTLTTTSNKENQVMIELINGSKSFVTNNLSNLKEVDISNLDSLTVFHNTNTSKNSYFKKQGDNSILITKGSNPLLKFPKKMDSIKALKNLTSIFVSVTEENLDLKKLSTLLKTELERKNIQMPFKLNHYISDKLKETNDSILQFTKPIKTNLKSTFLKQNETLEIEFPNQPKSYLKRGFIGILLSVILTMAIIASLFYLLNIIKKQKVIAEIKNDFISNITHEFKTPITTIGLAIEGIGSYTEQGNLQKTKEYLNITNNQLNKLTVMVEKILETSSLDSEKLLLKKEAHNVVSLVEKISAKFKVQHPEKEILFTTNTTSEFINLDSFHFENTINNIMDNAIKYGGDLIKVTLTSDKEKISIGISDSGIIPKEQKQKIFDKFYRIPQGNTHNTKGFGIGLYYAKKIIEKHKGTIELEVIKNTLFKITLPK